MAKWVNSESLRNHVKVELQGTDRMGILNDISSIISNNLHIDMKGVSINSNDGIFTGTITLEVKNKNQLDETLAQLAKIEGILKVRRL